MLEIHPLRDEQALAEYRAAHRLPEGAAVLRAYENDEVTGNASLSVEGLGEGALLTIHTWEYPDDFTGELLLRAVISYAFNRAVPTVAAPKELRNALTDRVGFEERDGRLVISTKKVVHFCQK